MTAFASNPTPSRACLEAWLRLQAPEAEVGTALCNDNCTFARFLRSQGFVVARVYPYEWSEQHHGAEDTWHRMPAWATAFTQAEDETYGAGDPDGMFHRVTAAEALAVLLSLELPQEVIA